MPVSTDFLSALSQRVLLFDGAMGTMLAASLPDFDGVPELINLKYPAAVQAIHAAYVHAGAEVVETNSLGTNPIKLRTLGLEDQTEALITAAIQAARRAGAPYVAMSIGGCGELLAPYGTLTHRALYEATVRQVKAAEDAGADLLFIETQIDAAEARVMAQAAREATKLPVAISFTYEMNKRTLTGSLPQTAALCVAAYADVLGVNCSGGPAQMNLPLAAYREVSSLPVVVQPNAGLPAMVDGKAVYALHPQQMAESMQALIAQGASAIGGCCGTTPAHIAAMLTHTRGVAAPVASAPAQGLITSLRKTLPLKEALEDIAVIDGNNPDDILEAVELCEAGTILLDVSALSPTQIETLLPEVQALTTAPLLFQAQDADRLAAALTYYQGKSAVRTAPQNASIAAHHGALLL